MASDKPDTSEPSERPDLPELNTNLAEELNRIDSSLASLYIGARIALSNSQNPDRIRQSAVSIRQLIKDLPKLDARVKHSKDVIGMRVVVQVFKNNTGSAETIAVDDTGFPKAQDTPKLKKIMKAVLTLRKYLVESGDSARDIKRALLDGLDTARGNLPESDQDVALKKWMEADNYFNLKAHDETTTVEEYTLRLQAFEALLVETLIPNAAERIDEIDDFIEEIEQ